MEQTKHLYEVVVDEETQKHLDMFRRMLSSGSTNFGVTLNGNRLTLRTEITGQHVEMHCIIDNISVS